ASEGDGSAVRSFFGAQRSPARPGPGRRGLPGGPGNLSGGIMKDRWTRVMGFPAAALAGCVSIWLSSGFTQQRRDPPAGVPGMTVDAGGIALTPGAPQWRVLKLGVVQGAAGRWTDPVPARGGIDETRASKGQGPLSGRVARGLVEVGRRVKEGGSLFSVGGPA